jgi:hypothetical protein
MEQMGLLKYPKIDTFEEKDVPDLIEIELGGGVLIRPHANEDHTFLIAIRQRDNGVIIISGISYFNNINFSKIAPSQSITSFGKDSMLKLELLKYLMGKGPPLKK